MAEQVLFLDMFSDVTLGGERTALFSQLYITVAKIDVLARELHLDLYSPT